MPNLYITPAEIKQIAPDTIQSAQTAYDEALLILANRISRLIDKHCERVFYPTLATRYFDGSGEDELWIDDIITVTTVSYSNDDGTTYTDLTTSDWIGMRGKSDYNHPGSYNMLKADVNGSLGYWPRGQKSIKIVGVWAYADDRTDCWENSQDTVEDNPLSSSATSLTVNDVDGADLWGATPRISAGSLLQMGSEYAEVTATNTTTNIATIVRGRNGSTAAAHVQNVQIDLWRPPEMVKQAALAQSVHQFKRASNHYGDAEADLDMQKVIQLKALVPEVQDFLAPFIKRSWGG